MDFEENESFEMEDEFNDSDDFEMTDDGNEVSGEVLRQLDENEEIVEVEEIQLSEPPARIEIVDTMPDNVKDALKTFNEILDYSRVQGKKDYEMLNTSVVETDDSYYDEEDFEYDDSSDEQEISNIEVSEKEFDETELDTFF